MPDNFLPTSYQEFIHLSRYSRWLPEEGRRETWNETVTRYFDFFTDHVKEMTGFDIDKDLRKSILTHFIFMTKVKYLKIKMVSLIPFYQNRSLRKKN